MVELCGWIVWLNSSGNQETISGVEMLSNDGPCIIVSVRIMRKGRFVLFMVCKNVTVKDWWLMGGLGKRSQIALRFPKLGTSHARTALVSVKISNRRPFLIASIQLLCSVHCTKAFCLVYLGIYLLYSQVSILNTVWQTRDLELKEIKFIYPRTDI